MTGYGWPRASEERLVQVVAPHFVAGFTTTDGRVRRAAPALRYMLGWAEPRAIAYCNRKGWEATHLPDTLIP